MHRCEDASKVTAQSIKRDTHRSFAGSLLAIRYWLSTQNTTHNWPYETVGSTTRLQ